MTEKTNQHRLLRGIELAKLIYRHRVFRFLVAGGLATAVDLGMFYLFFNFIFHQKNVAVGGLALSPSSAALVISYSCGALCSFLINRFFVFGDKGSWKAQVLRFIPVNLAGFAANFVLLRGLIYFAHLWPTFARACSALIVAFATFNLHKYFTFRKKSHEPAPEL